MIRRRRHDVVVFDLDDPGASGPPDSPAPDDAGRGGHGHIDREAVAHPSGGPGPDDRASDESTGSDLGDAVDGEAPGRRPRGTRTRRLREAVVAGTVVVVALAAWGVTTAVHEHERVTRLLDAPGGVLSLAHAPTQAWSADTGSSGQTLFLPGIVAVRRGTVLHGLDAATGDERWQAEIGGDPDCTVMAGALGGVAVVDPIVCWSGPNAATSTVTVVHADGSSSTRDLGEDVDAVGAAAEGALVTARRVGPVPPATDIQVTGNESTGWSMSGSIDQGQDVVLRLEDAATGDLRWERTVAFRPVEDVHSCAYLNLVGNGTETKPMVDLTNLSVAAYPALVTLHGCGLDAGFTMRGDPTYDPGQSAWSTIAPYADGGALEQVGGDTQDIGVASVLHGPDGTLVGTYQAQVLNPWATDGSPTDVLLTGSAGVTLTAVDRDGTERWHDTHVYSDLLVRTAAVAVLLRGDMAVSGVDLHTGAVLWTDENLLAGTPADVDRPVHAFTDGTVAALATVPSSGPGSTLVGLDVATGAVRWSTPLGGDFPQISAAQGRLVEVVQTGDSWIRTGDDGTSVRDEPGTVTVLH